MLIFEAVRNSDNDGPVNSEISSTSIPLSEFASSGSLNLLGTQSLAVNGQLRANESFVLAPQAQPSKSERGQLYFDSGTNQLAYFNGSQFVQIPGNEESVLTLQGQSGDITLVGGVGLAVDGTTLTNTGVTSFGGVTGDITLGAGVAIVDGALSNSGVVGAAAGSGISVVDDGNGNITISTSGAGTGTVTSPNGTPGRIAKFTGVQTIEDSLLSEAGSAVTVNGDLHVTGATTLASALGVNSGGSGATSFTANGVIIGNGSGALTAVAAGGPGECLMSNAGAPSFQACPGGGGGVTALNGLTGALTIANASTAGSTITLNDASTSQKGIAQFNSTNFTAASGVVNTIQDINIAAAPTFGRLTVTSSQASNAMLLINNTNVGASGNLLDVQLNGSSRLAVSPAGNMTLVGTVNGQTISSAANLTGTLAVAGAANLNGGATVTGTLTANTITPTGALTIGATTQSFLVQGSAASTITATSGANTTSLAFQSPTAAVTYRLLTAAAGTYDVCTTVGNCAGVGGGITGAGTNNRMTKFTSTGTVGDSSVIDNGSSLTLDSNIDLLLQGVSAYISNPQTQSNSEAFGLNASVTGANAVALGNSAAAAVQGVAIGSSSSSASDGIAIGYNADSTGGLDSIALGSNATTTAANQMVVGSSTHAITSVHIGNGVTNAAPSAFTLQGTSGSGTNVAGATVTIASGAGTGDAAGGNINLQVATPGVSGSNANVLATVFSLSGTNGSALFKNIVNSASAFEVQTAGGAAVLTVSTSTNGVTLAGDLAVNGGDITSTGALNITPGGALTMGTTSQAFTLQGDASSVITATDGGITNSLTFATPSGSNKTIIMPNASGTLVVSASGPLAIDAAGNITCATCATAGSGVTSVNSLTGALTVANATTGGSTITLNDASTSQKGIAQFNSTNFSAASGVVNTIQNINTAAAPTFGQLTLTSNQSSAAMIVVNNTNVSASGNLLDLQLNGASRLSVSPAGAMTIASTINGQTISSAANLTGTLAVAGATNLNGGATVTGTLGANNLTPSSALTVGATGQSFLVQGNASSTITATNSGNTTTLSFQTPTANVNYRLLTAAAGTYDICTTVGNCAGVGGGVTTPGGTTGKIAKFTASGVIGDSIMTETGSVVSVAGTLAATTSVQTTLLDPASAVALDIGTSNASAITIGRSGVTTTVNGTFGASGNANISGALSANSAGITTNLNVTGTTSSGALSVTNDANIGGSSYVTGSVVSNNVTSLGAMTVGGTGNSLSLQGNASTSLSATSSGTTNSLVFATPTGGNKTITIPDATGTICLQNSTGCGFIQNTTSAQNANVYVQAAASGSVAAVIRANAAGAGDILDLKNGAGTDIATFSSIGAILFQNSFDSTTALTIKDAAGTATLLNVDTSNGRVGIGGVSSFSKFEVQGGDAAIYNNGANPRLILGDSTAGGQNGYLQWDSASDYFRIETVGTNGLKIKDNNVAIGNIFPGQPLTVGNGSTQLFQVHSGGTVSVTNQLTTGSFSGAGLTDCDASNSKLLWDATTSQFSCGTDRASFTVRRTADETVTSSTTLQDDDYFSFSIGANETWAFQMFYEVNSSETADWRMRVDAPTGATCDVAYNNIYNVTNVTADTCGEEEIIDQAATWDNEYITYGSVANGSTAGTVKLLWAQSVASGSSILRRGGYMVAYKLSGADMAEAYYTKDSTVGPGDIVQVDGSLTAGVQKSDKAYSQSTLGVVSTEPGFVLGKQEDALSTTGKPVLLALNGRVPVKVSTENGPVHAGDYLTASSTPGVAMKATRPGQMIGTALEDFSTDAPSGMGLVNVFVNPTWATPDASGLQLAGDATDIQGQKATTFNESVDVQGKLTVKDTFSVDPDKHRVVVGKETGDAYGTVLVLGNKTTAGDPEGTNGAMYYNGVANKFRCFEGGAWKDCVGEGAASPWSVSLLANSTPLPDCTLSSNSRTLGDCASPGAANRFITKADLSKASQARIVASGYNALSGGHIRLQYSSDGQTWKYLSDGNGPEATTGASPNTSDWKSLTADAKNDVWIRAVVDGTGTLTSLTNVTAQFK